MTSLFYKYLILPIKVILVYKNWAEYFLYYLNRKDRDFVFILRNGLKIKARKSTTDRQIINEICLLKIYSHSSFKLDKNSTVIDVGAHIGTFSLLMAREYAQNGFVYSYEPEINNFQALEGNQQMNRLHNIQIFQTAISDTTGEIKLYRNTKNSAFHNIFRETADFISVNAITLKDIFLTNKIGLCDLLKLDCEGCEYLILTHTPYEIFRKIHFITCEIHEKLGNYKLHDLINFLNKQNFEISEVKKTHEGDSILFAKNKFLKSKQIK